MIMHYNDIYQIYLHPERLYKYLQTLIEIYRPLDILELRFQSLRISLGSLGEVGDCGG